MAINFPNSPSNGDAHAGFIYNSTKGVWEASAASVPMSDSPPANPSQGDLWFDSSVAKTYIYYNDGSSSQWVQMNPSGGSDGADGADATGDGESPVIYTEPPTTVQSLNSDGTTSTVQMQAVDPEGTAITYGIAYANSTNARPAQLSADTTIDQSTGTYTFTPSTTESDAGTFKARLSASDGIQTSTRFVNFDLSFGIAIDLLMVAGGGGGGASGSGGGGGGGGGVITKSASSYSFDGSTSITIGSGGSFPGVTGGDTTGFGMTALGGGGSNTATSSSGDVDGKDGGSGGGGQAFGGGAGGSALQPSSTDGGLGYDGATGASAAGGGGGAGGAGANPAGGAGYTWVNGSTYAAGGNGWNGSNEGVSGGVNTGNGGNFHGGSGGSGIVIVRYSGTTQLATGGTITTSGGYTYHTFTSDGTFTVI